MKIVKLIKRAAAIALGLGIASIAAAEITGSGTEYDPYVLNTASDWNTFVTNVNSGTDADKYYRLSDTWDNSSSPVSNMAGTDTNRFKGTFDGNGKTLTVNINNSYQYAAPFRYVNGATFRNLTVAGTITSSSKYAAGFVARYENGHLSFENCISSVTINATGSGDGTHGGFVGCTGGTNSSISFNNCLFNGKLLGAARYASAGFVGWPDGGCSVAFTNCLYAPEEVTMGTEASAVFCRNFGDGSRSYDNSYYTEVYGEAKGTSAADLSRNELLAALGADWKLSNKKVIPVQKNTLSQAKVSGLNKPYSANGNALTFEYSVKDLYGNTLTKGTHFTEKFADSEGNLVSSIISTGTYTLILTGTGTYTGSKRMSFVVSEATLAGNGTETSPYIISSVEEWNTFASFVNNGAEFAYYKLSDNFDNSENPVTVMAGTSSNPFNGKFDGNGKTLTVQYNVTESYAAPFRYAGEAQFKNLTVAGTITSSAMHASGFVGYAPEENVTFTDCTSSVEITGTKNGDGTHGGFVGLKEYNTVTFTRCLFNGKLLGSKTNSSSGFLGYTRGGSVTYTNCLFAPVQRTMGTSSSCTFNRNGYNTFDHAYYTQSFGTEQGTQVYSTRPTGAVSKLITLFGTEYYTKEAVTVGLQGSYFADSNASTIAYTATYGSDTLTKETDFTESITDSEGNTVENLGTAGTYNLVLTFAGDYEGTKTVSFTVNSVMAGNGTETNPYIIASVNDWSAFKVLAETGEPAYYKLADNFDNTESPITVTVCTGDNPFKGVFDGNGKTLNVNISDTSTHGTAPFRGIGGGAVIKNLTVTGSVKGTTHTAGLVGFSIAEGTTAENPNTIENCTVSTDVQVITTSGNRHMGGVVGHATTSYLKIKDTVFNGTMHSGANYAGGLQGWSDGNGIIIENCLFAGTYTGASYFHPVAIKNDSGSIMSISRVTDCYYTQGKGSSVNTNYIAADGDQVSTTQPETGVYKTVFFRGTTYYASTEPVLSGFTGKVAAHASTATFPYTVKFGTSTLVKGTDYSEEITDSDGNAVENLGSPGTYTLTLTFSGNYSGTKTVTFEVISSLAGEGTELSPYIIAGADDWSLFAGIAGTGISAYYKLADDFDNSESPVTLAVGSSSVPFTGVFDGNGKTLNVNITATANGCGVFNFIENATVKNLTVAGTINGRNGSNNYKQLGGIAGFAKGENLISNCVVTANITTGFSGDSSIGGFLGEVNAGNTDFRNCCFTGSFNCSSANAFGGFNGWLNGSSTVSFENCLFAPSGITISSSYTSRNSIFSRGTNHTETNCYYTLSTRFDVLQGVRVVTAQPSSGCYKAVTFLDTTYYTTDTAVISGLQEAYIATGSALVISYAVEYQNTELISGTDYTAEIKNSNDETVTSVVSSGSYTLTLTFNGNYSGTQVVSFLVGSFAGEGTESSPYIISTAADWDLFTGITASAEPAYYKLSDDFDNTDTPVTTTVGSEAKPFKGVFDGNGKTLNVNINDSSAAGTAPFRGIGGGAVIKNLTIAGSVKGEIHTAGLVGYSVAEGTSLEKPNTIENCTISANVRVESSASGRRYMGGVVAHSTTSYLKIKDTVFNGTMYTSGDYAGGFSGWGGNIYLILENCLFAGSYTGSSWAIFHPIMIKPSGDTMIGSSVNGCYYTQDKNFTSTSYIGVPGTRVYTTLQSETLSTKVTLFGTDYYVAETTEITGLEPIYDATGDALDISYSVACGTQSLVKGTDYTQTFKNASDEVVENVVEPGVYTVVVTGTGSYFGSKTATFAVNNPLSGNGTEEDPYLIADMDDWNIFATNISNSVKLDKYYKLTANIGTEEAPVTAMVSTVDTDGKRFSGTLDGNGKTITVALSATSNDVALFRYVKDATFRNLTVTGTVNSSVMYAAGFASKTLGNTSFVDCTSSVVITGTKNGDGTHGGFVGMNMENGDAVLRFTRCTFNGKLLGENCISSSGFVGYNNNKKTIAYTDCLFAPAEITMSGTSSATFNRNGNATFTRCYATQIFGENQGTRISDTRPSSELYGTVTIFDGNTYYAMAEISGIESAYNYSGFDVSVACSVVLNSESLTKDTDYTVQFRNSLGAVVSAPRTKGEYTIIVTGEGAYTGSKEFGFSVVDAASNLETDTDSTLYVNMPKTGTKTVNITPLITAASFKVYDDGGKSAEYSNSCDGYLVITAPAGYTLGLSGSVVTESTSYDWLTVYDGVDSTATVLGSSKIGSSNGSVPSSTVTSGPNLTLYFRSDGSVIKSGLDLTVTLNAPYSTTCDYTLAFNANGGEGTMENLSFSGVEQKNLTANAFTREGYTFAGWSTAADGSGELYADEAEFWMVVTEENTTVTLYAQWTCSYSVAFNSNGGTGTMEAMSFTGAEKKALTANTFTREGATFIGWNTAANGSGTTYSDGQLFQMHVNEANTVVTLYAQWIVNITVNADPYSEGVWYGTFFDSATSYVADCEVYYVTGTEGSFQLTKADDRIIKAGKGVILKAASSVVTLRISSAESSLEDFGVMSGSDTAKTFTSEETAASDIYVLGLGINGVRFYKVSGEFTVGAHKAYIVKD